LTIRAVRYTRIRRRSIRPISHIGNTNPATGNTP
jgi:hypothetical protein